MTAHRAGFSAALIFTLVALSGGCHKPPPPISEADVRPTSAGPARPFISGKTQKQYAVIPTNERDEHERAEAEAEMAAGAPELLAAGGGDAFRGTARKAAKLSIVGGAATPTPPQPFNDVNDLIVTLVPDNQMWNRNPPISTAANSGRVQEENRNVSVRAWLYAASKEDDNDFHLIIGRGPSASPRKFMTVELSGLPPANNPNRAKLQAVRDNFKTFFGANLPGTKYDFYDPPIPVIVTGSLFFDAGHHAGQVGPSPLRQQIPTTWEIHPIWDMEFEP
jgi:hypothetical protein